MSKKFWLDFGGVRIEAWQSLSIRNRAVTFTTATGQVRFVPEYAYDTTNLNHETRRRFLGYRVVVNVDNIINAYSGEEVAIKELIGIINFINTPTRATKHLAVTPQFIASGLNYRFEDMEIVSDFEPINGEGFMCYQELSLVFRSIKLVRSIPNLFTQETYTPVPFPLMAKSREFSIFNNIITPKLT